MALEFWAAAYTMSVVYYLGWARHKEVFSQPVLNTLLDFEIKKKAIVFISLPRSYIIYKYVFFIKNVLKC